MDLFSDLDNTLIYSHRRKLPSDKVPVERLNGVNQSFMTGRTLRFLRDTPWLRLIPVTTRSIEQYQRIFIFEQVIPCRYALVCNGGELLIDGTPDAQWLEETRRLAAPELPALSEALEAMRTIIPPEHIHTPSRLMAYGKCEDPTGIADFLKSKICASALDILCDKRKIYCLPRSINKGAALKRFQRRFATEFVVAAGDSKFDISLLNTADLAITDSSLTKYVSSARTISPDSSQLLSDCLCSALEAFQLEMFHQK